MESLPIFVRLRGRPVILLAEGEAGEAKRRLLERAGAAIVGENSEAQLALIALADPDATAAAARLRARGLLINVADRPDLCDFTLPAIVDRSPVVVAIGTNGASAGLAAALRQRLEAMLPTSLGALARALFEARAALRRTFPDPADRRRAIATMLAPGGTLDPFSPHTSPTVPVGPSEPSAPALERLVLRSSDPDDLTLREARLLAQADRLYHAPDAPPAILDRARADAARIVGPAPALPLPGLSVEIQ